MNDSPILLSDCSRKTLVEMLKDRSKTTAADSVAKISRNSPFDDIFEIVMQDIAPSFPIDDVAKVLQMTDSAIERKMFFALCIVGCCRYEGLIVHHKDGTSGFGKDNNKSWLHIAPQFEIEKYRADFFIQLEMKPNQLFDFENLHLIDDAFLSRSDVMVVECDGHEFHEKKRYQASRDKKRDRDMYQKGLFVFRFTGSEINSDTFSCANQVCNHLEYGVIQKMGLGDRETPKLD